MPWRNKCLVDSSLLNILSREKAYVRRVADYILTKLKYGENTISLKGSEVAEYEEMTTSDVSRGITRLEELGIIAPCNTLPILKYTKVKKSMYVVNHNFIFRGNLKKLVSEFEEQQALLDTTENPIILLNN